MHILIAAAAALLGTSAAQASLVDDFNRADALTIGDSYTVQNGNFRISGNKATTTNFVSLATYNGSNSSTVGVDASLRGFDSGSYVALTLGYGSADSYFIKIQDNDGDGFFDRYGFDTGNNDLTGPFNALGFGFQAGSIDVSVTGTVATLSILANGNTLTYSYDYGFAPGNGLAGFGLNRLGVADNLRFDSVPQQGVPEPASWALMIGGFGLAGAAMRGRRRTVLA
jgi:hypothetical protein